MKKVLILLLILIFNIFLFSCSSNRVKLLNDESVINRKLIFTKPTYSKLFEEYIGNIYYKYDDRVSSRTPTMNQSKIKEEFDKGNRIIIINFCYNEYFESEISINSYKVKDNKIIFIFNINTPLKEPFYFMKKTNIPSWVSYQTFVISFHLMDIAYVDIGIINLNDRKLGTSMYYYYLEDLLK
jgi:hypothetical protein